MPTWKEIADKRRKENFVGRAEQLRVFLDNFTGDEPRWMVLSITGEGGVGKSTLLKRYAQECRRPDINANVVLCDDRHYSPVEAMAAIAEQLSALGIKSGDFDERLKKYRQALQQIESDPSAPRGMVHVVTRGLTDLAVKSLRRVPGIGLAMDYVDEKATGEALAELAQYAMTRWGNKDEVLLVREPEKVLTPLFVDLLNEAARKKRLVVMFDVFERTARTLSAWLMNLFDSQYGEIDWRVSFVLSGRDPLDQHWTELAGLMTHVRLEPFTREETAIYLSNHGITDPTLIEQIHKDTGGLPVLVELLAAANPQPGQPLPDVSGNAVKRFLQWTPDELRPVPLLAAIPRQFNKDILMALLGDDGAAKFDWLVDQSYIRCDSERGWFYHEKVRALMLRYQRNLSPRQLDEHHQHLADYFAQQQARMNLPPRKAYENETWRRYEAERFYHAFSVAPEERWPQTAQAFMLAFYHRWRFAARLPDLVRQVLEETRCAALKTEAGWLEAIITAYDKDEYERFMQSLNRLTALVAQEPGPASAFYASRGMTYGLMGKNYDALRDFDRAIALDETMARAIASRGTAHLLIGKYDEALRDFDRAIALDEKDAWAIASRGETYRLMGQYD